MTLKLSRRRMGATALAAAALAVPAISRGALAQERFTGISHRHGSLEAYARIMDQALPGVRVEMNMMPVDRAFELQTINLSSSSDAYDIIWVNDAQIKLYAKNGWIEPIDELWARHRAEFALDDYPESVLDSFRYDGRLYGVPAQVNGMFMFYRADLFRERNVQPPSTFEDWLSLAQAFNTRARAGTVMSMKRVDAALNESHYYMNAFADGWFDRNWRPVFNNDRGVAAIERMRSLARFAPPDYLSHANDEASITFQQGLAVMGLQWFSRAASMDDPAHSRVVNQIQWASPPNGGQRIVVDGYSIAKFTRKSKETIFRVLATALNEANQREVASVAIPSRGRLLADAQLQARYRYYPAALQALRVGKPYPALPEFPQVGDLVTRRIHQALTGEMTVNAALDAAAAETQQLLAQRGYYR